MERFLLIFLILFPMAAAFAVRPLRNRSRQGRNLWIQIVPPWSSRQRSACCWCLEQA